MVGRMAATPPGPPYQVPAGTGRGIGQEPAHRRGGSYPFPMQLVSRPTGPRRRVRALVLTPALLLAAAFLAAGCAAPAPPADPAAACAGADVQSRAGFYPELEGRLPTSLGGKAPESIESGRYCSEKTLGPLVASGIDELHFAAALWPASDTAGLAVVVYEASGLTARLAADAFQAGADAARQTQETARSEPTIAGRPGFRFEYVNGESRQVVVIWPGISARGGPDRHRGGRGQ